MSKRCFPLETIVTKISHNPARRYQISERGFIREGYWADLVLVDMQKNTKVCDEEVRYKCGWTPFKDVVFGAKIKATYINGEEVYDGSNVLTEKRFAQELIFKKVTQLKGLLDIRDHDRNIFDTRYVYPVVSRRAGGVSVGINLNVNNACNWRCVYCQVPKLVRGKAADIDLKVLRLELEALLSNIKSGSFFEKFVSPEFRRLNDVALSGNGEPTSSLQLPDVLDIIQETKDSILNDPIVKTVLITNGSLLHSGKIRVCYAN